MKKVFKILNKSVYGVPVIIFIGELEEFIEYQRKKFKRYNISIDNYNYSLGLTEPLQNTKTNELIILIWMPNYKHTIRDLATLSHECLHASLFILESREIKFDYKNDEILTYLHTFILEEALYKLEKDFKNNAN